MKRFIVAALLILATFTLALTGVSAQGSVATGIVNTPHLNVRSTPDPINGTIIARVGQNESYLVTARSATNNWWQIRLSDGRLGWVNGTYMNIYNGHLVPVINASTGTTVTSMGTVTAFYLNVRATPDPINGVIIARIQRNETYTVVGRNPNTTSGWYQIRLADGRLGWVNGRYLSVTNAGSVPITDNTVPPQNTPTAAIGTVTAYYLNVRTAPSASGGSIIGVITRGQVYAVVGRTADMSWWQIQYGNTTGWVSDRYLSVINYTSVPVTW